MTDVCKPLSQLKINEPKIGGVPLAPKKAPGTIGQPVQIATNIKRIDLKPNTPIYKYRVDIGLVFARKDGKETIITISDAPKNDVERSIAIKQCFDAYKFVIKNNQKDFNQKDQTFFYDRQSSLYTLKIIPSAEQGKTYTVPVEILTKNEKAKRVDFKITKVNESFCATSNDIKQSVNLVPNKIDRTLIEALNIVISEPALTNENVITYSGNIHYLIDPSICGFRESDFLNFENGMKYSSIGLSKTVKPFSGVDGKPSLYMVGDVKKSLFHYDSTPLLEKLMSTSSQPFNFKMSHDSMEARSLLKTVKNLSCYITYGTMNAENGPIVVIKSFGPPANHKDSEFYSKDWEKTVNVQQYFKQKFNVDLKYPGLFTIRGKINGKAGLFPVELLTICESQLVRTDQMIGKEQEESIKKSAMPPIDRKRQTDIISKSIGFNSNVIGGIVKISPECVVAPGRQLPAPTLKYSKSAVPIRNGTSWRGAQFLDAKTIQNWMCVFIETQRLDTKRFMQMLYTTASKCGMNLNNVPATNIQRLGRNELEKLFNDAKQRNVTFLFFVVRDRLDIHSDIKMLEHKYEIITQEVRLMTASKIVERNQFVTLENIINKINIKNGGLNFALQGSDPTNDGTRLILGFESSRTATNTDLCMVGYSANVLDHPHKFGGGYVYTKRDAKFSDPYGSIITSIVTNALKKTYETRKVKPSSVLIYFNGITDGQWPLINEVYSKKVKEAFENLNKSYNPKVTLVAVSKIHNERLYKTNIKPGKPSEQNIAPGTIVDKVIVNPVVNEFYLTAQNAFQGTAKSPKFTVIYDTANISMNELETCTYSLCFLHEIVNASVSIPAPLMIADRFSKRATMLYTQSEFVRSKDENIDIEDINTKLSSEGKPLEFTRYNA